MDRQKIAKPIVLVALLGIIIFAAINFRHDFQLDQLQAMISGFGIWAPIVFMLIYITATVLFLPGAALTLLGGLLFGPWWGTLYNIVGATLGAAISFLIARYLVADWARVKTGSRLKQLTDGIDKEGWKFVAIVRLVPLIPFNLLNYALGLTRIRLLPYVIASFIFMLPACFAYTYAGSLGKAFIEGGGTHLISKIAIAIGLLILVACIPWLMKHFRQGETPNAQ